MKKSVALFLTLALAFSCASASAVTVLSMGTGGTSGTYYAFGSEIAGLWKNNIPDIEVTPQATGASKENVMNVNDGEFQLGWSQNDVIFYAYTADKEQFRGEKLDNFYALAALYPEAVQIVVAADSDIRDVADLKGKNVSVGSAGSGTAVNAQQVLEAAGLTFNDIKMFNYSFGDSADAYNNMQIDAFFVTAGIPNTGIISAAVKRPVRLLTLTDEQMTALQSKYSFYVPVTVKAGTYQGLDADVTIPSTTAVLICEKTIEDDLAYNLVKTLFEKKGDLTHEKAKALDTSFAVEGIPCPIHPGAARYFTELGLEIPEQSRIK